MTVEWESHRGEEQLSIVADRPEEVLLEAIDAFSRLVERGSGGVPATREIDVTATDPAGVLVELLNELVYLAETEGFVADRAAVDLGEGRVRASLEGRLTTVASLVKAATYHELRFERQGGSWHARVVLDV